MTKWMGKILIILLIFLSTSCKNRVTEIEFNSDFIDIYDKEIYQLLGEIKILNKERVSETFYGYNLTQTIHYDVWEIEYKKVNQELNRTIFKNRYDFISSLGEVIVNEMTEEVIEKLDLDPDNSDNFENGIEGYETLNDIDSRYYPVNLRLDELPDDLLIVISPREDQVKDFNESLLDIIDKINYIQINNVLLLYGDDAYQMDQGIFVTDGVVIDKKISVEDALKWIESNR